MMLFPAGIERTRAQWQNRLDSVGLRIVKICTNDKMVEPVLQVRLKD